MTTQDYDNLADLIARVIQRVRAAPELNLLPPQDAILAAVEMIEHEFRQAHEIMPVDA